MSKNSEDVLIQINLDPKLLYKKHFEPTNCCMYDLSKIKQTKIREMENNTNKIKIREMENKTNKNSGDSVSNLYF
jgi:hypothetical protein